MKKKINLKSIIDEEIKQSSIRNGFPKSFSPHVQTLRQKSLRNHKDLTQIPFVTIDGQDSRDFDDAVWCENKGNLTRIMVAISDVSFYVKRNDPLDIEARKRGNSFYFPDRVISMFPDEISTDICSLVPCKTRPCIVVEIKIKNLRILNFNIHRAKIKSVARLTYNEVEEIFVKNLKSNKYYNLIRNLFQTYNVLKQISKNRNKINFFTNEFEISNDLEDNFSFKKKKRLTSYKIIEEFMIIANETIAKYLKSNNLSSIFRNHEKPKDEKIKKLKEILKENSLYKNEKFSIQKDFNKILNKIDKNNFFLNDSLLRVQTKAYYCNQNLGHFGLGLDHYTHFTSPIRRYSDLHVHRDLTDHIFNDKKIKNTNPTSLSDHLTIQEKKADTIERQIIDRACSLYIKNTKRRFFKGIIDGVESFGIFIKAIELPFSCLARVKSFNFNKVNRKIKRNYPEYKIGQTVSFKIKRNNIKSGKILAENVKILVNYE